VDNYIVPDTKEVKRRVREHTRIFQDPPAVITRGYIVNGKSFLKV
jgi:hypothetical protein